MKAISNISSAISLGVRLRAAPSTIAIILSRKLSPSSCVTRTTSQSERTVVPPVTALRSPPASRITGADSPVIADSSTEAAPSITSPSAGTCSPARTMKMSPFLSMAEAISVPDAWSSAFESKCAVTSRRAALSESAWALPRPSAIASAKFAKSAVSQSTAAIPAVKPKGASRTP